MDIRQWGLDRIMQLPDWCFGQRWLVACEAKVTGAFGRAFDISEAGLPDICVIWQLVFYVTMDSISPGSIELSLGDHLPANEAEFLSFQTIFKDFGWIFGLRRSPHFFDNVERSISMRKVIHPQGRRLVLYIVRDAAGENYAGAGIVISSLPKEVPDWLVSGNHRSL